MNWRRLLEAITTGLLLSWIVGVLVDVDVMVMWVQEIVAWIIPDALDDGRFWALTDASMVVILTAPGLIVGVYFYTWRNRQGDGHTRYRKCGYILKGITEPRCSECGERI